MFGRGDNSSRNGNPLKNVIFVHGFPFLDKLSPLPNMYYKIMD